MSRVLEARERSACPNAREPFSGRRPILHTGSWKTALIEMINDGRCPFCGRVMIEVSLVKGGMGLSWFCAGYKP